MASTRVAALLLSAVLTIASVCAGSKFGPMGSLIRHQGGDGRWRLTNQGARAGS